MAPTMSAMVASTPPFTMPRELFSTALVGINRMMAPPGSVDSTVSPQSLMSSQG